MESEQPRHNKQKSSIPHPRGRDSSIQDVSHDKSLNAADQAIDDSFDFGNDGGANARPT